MASSATDLTQPQINETIDNAKNLFSSSVPVLEIDITDTEKQQELMMEVEEEKEEDEFRADFPVLYEQSHKLDEDYSKLKSDYGSQIQEATNKLEEIKMTLRKRQAELEMKESQKISIHENLANNIALLKDSQTTKFRKCVEEFKKSLNVDPNEAFIKYINYKYSVNLLEKPYVFDKLSDDINDFCKHVKIETELLKKSREILISEIRAYVRNVDINLDIRIYGSYAVDLSLPCSDIDIIITPNNIMRPNSSLILERLNELLRIQKYVRETKMIINTSMPVLRVECTNEMNWAKLDITVFDARHKGIECVEMVKKELEEYPVLEKLILVLKHMLKSSELNDPYKGGLSSYGLFLLLLAYLQWFPDEKNEPSIGKLLIKILQFYSQFDFRSTSVFAQYPYIDPMSQRSRIFMRNEDQLEQPMVIDPLVKATTNNVTKSTLNMTQVKKIMRISIAAAFYDCPCCTHRKDAKSYKKCEDLNMDRSHSILTNIFAVIIPFKYYPFNKPQPFG